MAEPFTFDDGAKRDALGYEREFFAELAKSKQAPHSLAVRSDFSQGENDAETLLPTSPAEGQLTVDVFHDSDNIYIQSAVAGVDPDNLDINITKESVSIRGKRARTHSVEDDQYFYQECFWGTFSRSVVLPEEIDPDKSVAALKNGVLTIKMPKLTHRRSKSIKVKLD